MNDRADAVAVLQQRVESCDVTADDLDGERGERFDGIIGQREAPHAIGRLHQLPHEKPADIARRPGHEDRVAFRVH